MDLQYTLMNSAVLQRTTGNVSCHPVSGKCRASGKVIMTVRQDKSILPELSGVAAGTAEKGKLSAVLKGIPAGGPYTIELQIAGSKEKAVFKDILVGDLWLLAGQSNMADSAFRPSPTPIEPMVHGFYMDNTWNIAQDPLHDTTRAAAPVHGGNPANPPRKERGAGPGRAFGNVMFQFTGVPQGLIACAHGGTSLEQWAPSKKHLKGNSLYGALYERLQYLGGRVAGVLWYQGCNSTNTSGKAAAFARDTRKVFNALRKDCNDPELPIVFAQLASYISAPDCQRPSENWLKVRNDQYVMAQKLANTACVPTIDLPLADTIHISADAADTLGKRMAEAMLYLKGLAGAAPQITVKNISLKKDRNTGFTEAVITFDNVIGSLKSGTNPTGFALVNKQGKYHSDAINCRL
ncbi:MAG: sialate O-acetylesterase, partial [Lentisphaeria bacterium]|nr:sialate O-acetylesterase [Lentisphaeria bacterium]